MQHTNDGFSGVLEKSSRVETQAPYADTIDLALKDLDAAAREVLGGGASSPVRAGKRVGGAAFYQSRGEGALAFDHRGRAHIDYLMGYGPLLFGYRVPGREQMDAWVDHGVLFGSTHPAEIRLAERIRGLLPSMERLRFTSTGTEAVMSAVRLARAATGRSVIVRFGGNYHGTLGPCAARRGRVGRDARLEPLRHSGRHKQRRARPDVQ